jgi:hypothetical protein
VNRLLLYTLMWLVLAVSTPVRASVLDELGQSLLSGSAVTDRRGELPISLQDSYPTPEQNSLAAVADRTPQNSNKPSLFLMPVGRSDELGVGVGIRFPF